MAYLCFKMFDNGYGRYYGITNIQNCIIEEAMWYVHNFSRLSLDRVLEMKHERN
jgi:hypothetical protein